MAKKIERTDIVEKEVSQTKMRTSNAKFTTLFAINTTKAGKLILKPKIGKFGVKEINFTTNNGEIYSLGEEDVLFTTTKSMKGKNGGFNITEAFFVEN